MNTLRTAHLMFLGCILFLSVPIATSAASTESTAPLRIDPPITISSNGGGAEASVYFSPQELVVTRVTASGAAYNTVEFSITGGADRSLFVMNPYTGQLSLFPEAKNKIVHRYPYEIVVSAVDSAGSTDDQTIYAIPSPMPHQISPARSALCGGTHLVTHADQAAIESIDVWVLGSPTDVSALKIGNAEIPAGYVTIWRPSQEYGLSRIHVDVPSRLSEQTGVFTVEWQDNSVGSTCQYSAVISQESGFDSGSSMFSGTTQQSRAGGTQNGATPSGSSNQGVGEETAGTTTSTSSVVIQDTQCARTSPWLWATLIIAQIIVLVVVYRNAAHKEGTSGGPVSVAAVASFIVLAALWYFFDSCRSYVWFPVLAVIISCTAIITTLTQEKER